MQICFVWLCVSVTYVVFGLESASLAPNHYPTIREVPSSFW